MKKAVLRSVSVLLCLLLISLLLPGCVKEEENFQLSDDPIPIFRLENDDSIVRNDARSTANSEKILTVGASEIPSLLNPFSYTPAPSVQSDVLSLIHLPLLTLSADSMPISGLEAESVCYSHSVSEDGLTLTFVLKNGVRTASGERLTASDVEKTIYVLLDPLYDGELALSSLPIEGLAAYRWQPEEGETADVVRTSVESAARKRLDEVIDGNGDEEARATVQKYLREAIASDFRSIYDLSSDDTFSAYASIGLADVGLPPLYYSLAACVYFGILTVESDGPDRFVFTSDSGLDSERIDAYSEDELIDACLASICARMNPSTFDSRYGWNCVTDNGDGNRSLNELCRIETQKYLSSIDLRYPSVSGVTTGYAVCEDGIVRESLTVKLASPDNTALWQFLFFVLPSSCYPELSGTETLSSVGLPFADPDFLTSLLGTEFSSGFGPYFLTEREEGKLTFSSNDAFLLGAPYAARLSLVLSDPFSNFEAIRDGEIALAQTEATRDKLSLIETDGKYSVLAPILTDVLGYGYIGINTLSVPSIAVRRALFSTMDVSLSLLSYPSGLGEPIYRSSSLSSWTSPESVSSFYPFDGTGETAKQYLISAGYSESGGKIVDSSGNQLSFVFTLPVDASMHPSGRIFLKSIEILEKIGVQAELVTDVYLTDYLTEGGTAVWAAAWSSSPDGSVFEVFCSDMRINDSALPECFGLYRLFSYGSEEEKALCIEINEKLYDILSQTDPGLQSGLYADLFDLIMELAIELPVYQRRELYCVNTALADGESFSSCADFSSVNTPLKNVWRLSLSGS